MANTNTQSISITIIALLISSIIKLIVGDHNKIIINCIESERQALLSFKHGLDDPNGMLFSWSNEDCCNWERVICSNITTHVIQLHLHGSNSLYLSGNIGPSLLQLTHLTHLDLSINRFTGIPIPSFIGSLANLRYLNLSYNNFYGVVPPNLSNLSSLQTLDLQIYGLSSNSLKWISTLSSLQHLDLSLMNLENASDWMQVINKLPQLKTLILSSCELPPPILPSYDPYANISTPCLSMLDLSENHLTSSVFPWLLNFNSCLFHLNLGYNNLRGYIPIAFGNLTSLSYVFLGLNQLEGASPNSFWNFCNLNSLLLPANKLRGTVSDFLRILPSCALHSSLQHLDLFFNNFNGMLPDFSTMPNLTLLDLSSNEFSGTIPMNLGQLSNLETLCLDYNSLEGNLFENHFLKLTKLRSLDFSHNSLSFHPHSNWVPPFHLDSISLSSCNLGPNFPNWLQGQNFSVLDISDAHISDIIPLWFWNLSSNLQYLDLSKNKIRGEVPNLSIRFNGLNVINLRSNEFEGQIPAFFSQVSYRLDVSNNKFSGSAGFFHGINAFSGLRYLDISNNQFLEEVPSSSWGKVSNLLFLSMASNGFSGVIPTSLSNLKSLQSLHLNNNSFSGEFPTWLITVLTLQVVNLEGNKLSGPIPTWIGNGSFRSLAALSLRSNQFYGDFPSSLCNLRGIQILDLSLNNITGVIPNCLSNLTSLTSKSTSFDTYNTPVIFVSHDRLQRIDRQQDYFEMIPMTWKGRESMIGKGTLRFLKSIDFSGNRLTGEIPNGITQLVGLNTLNLSRNNLSGEIPENMGELRQLDFLDLSRNELVGHIPSSLSQISGLSVMDLSYNKLSGRIPTGTQLQSFNASTYVGNSGLCGSPLERCVEEEEKIPDSTNKKTGLNNVTTGFYISLAIGFIVGFWGVCGSLLFITTWRNAYFGFFSFLNDWFYVKIRIFINKMQRLMHRIGL